MLVETYLAYQDYLFRKAAQEQGIGKDGLANADLSQVKIDLVWLEKARTEGAVFVEEANRLLDLYRQLFVGSDYLWMPGPTGLGQHITVKLFDA